jgi:hypothetical protein
MKTRQALIALLVGFFVAGAGDAYFAATHVREPGWWVISSTIALSLMIFAWYYFDSELHAFKRSKWLNIAVVGFAFFAIPYYVFRSREKGLRARALLKLVGFAALCFGLQAIVELAVATVG